MKRHVGLAIGIALIAAALSTPAQAAKHAAVCTGVGIMFYGPSLTKTNALHGESVFVGKEYGLPKVSCVPTGGLFVPSSFGVYVVGHMSCPLHNTGKGMGQINFGYDYGANASIKVTGTTSHQRTSFTITSGGYRGKVTADWFPVGNQASQTLTCPKSGLGLVPIRMVFTYQSE